MKSNRWSFPLKLILLFGFLTTICEIAGCTSSLRKQNSPLALKKEKSILEEKWGVRVSGIRLSAAGYMLDFRYQIVDYEKAQSLFNGSSKPHLIDQASGTMLYVPNPPKVGPLQQIAIKPNNNRRYFILFANPGRFVKPGNKVSVVIGQLKIQNLIVDVRPLGRSPALFSPLAVRRLVD